MFILALHFNAKNWKQQKCPSTTNCVLYNKFSNKKEGIIGTCNNIDKSQMLYAKLKKLD